MKTFKMSRKKYNCHDIAVSIFKKKRNIIGTLNQEIINENFRRYINILTDKDEIIVDIFKGTISKYRKNKIVYFKKFKNNTQESMIKANLVKFIKILNNKHYNNYDLSSSIYDAELAIKKCTMINKIKNNILITICAKGNSKGLKNKNIKQFFNKPLITHAIDKVLKNFKYICISTESKKIQNIAKKKELISFLQDH